MKRLKIGKKKFVKALTDIKKGIDQRNELQDILSKYVDDGTCLLTIGNCWLDTALDLLSNSVYDQSIDFIGTTIEWWLYEDIEKVIWIDTESTKNGKKETKRMKIDVSTPEKLYDYFRKYN